MSNGKAYVPRYSTIDHAANCKQIKNHFSLSIQCAAYGFICISQGLDKMSFAI